jgi:glucosyl-3-phosphoglycerate synthase
MPPDQRSRARPFGIDAVVSDWFDRRTYAADTFTVESLVARKRVRVSVVLPARNVGATLGPILDALLPLTDAGLVDELVVVDGASVDDTRAVARARDVTVYDESELMPDFGPVLGKGDALWRSLSVTSGDVVVFLDADTDNFGLHFATGLIGPLLLEPGVVLVKGAYRRPFRVGGELVVDGGGRVTELLARPWLNLHVPELTGFVQPLAGEIAARRSLLESISFPVGYGVEIGILLDALRAAGLDALAQVDLGSRQNQHQPLRDLGAMAYAVLVAAEGRMGGAGDVRERVLEATTSGTRTRSVTVAERPSHASLAKPAV